ncbi:UDP-4-amino-4,6-dideoxy-N-acetyl-beta-L-altrosamine transaminase [Uliginosibacterium sp. TH139]|uniref:UDP-4-amino-4, 6-dideoxy-N-acetyl-beta-L-altrosamine transaminase n=1 Tax=Uliginosibacterium sp. TH139 TaxID=2067453 RepID=UPI000C7A4605|nr:UDP-4-amino-4,6-dideoxy-N-acetyl-beta-L-altrosamine transaminase [Uliginosibacterium sp. TH139]PLK48792.1 UDP-4-amino-4,6-dideoxy-N-acetyl-beta-L-altrosamine transaminase [Uliginosibacterium sp. TH139]
MIPYGRQDISEADIAAVSEVLRSDWLTQGPVVPRFEAAIADHCGAAHAVAVNSATSALHIACLALGLGPGDALWTSPTTFVASANCALYCGASVDFVDIDPVSYNLCPQRLEAKLLEAEALGRLPKIVIPVHLCGQPCEMAAIHALSVRFGFRIIEDASHAIGARYQNEPVGNCRYSDITVFSFHPVKIITTGEGGMALTNDTQLARQMELLRSHGITREAGEMGQPPDGPWYYEQITLGFNYRMTELQAALGLSQLSRLDEFVRRRQQLALRYDQLLANLPLTLPVQATVSESARHLYVIRLQEAAQHRFVFEALRAAGIGVNLHYIPVHLQPWYHTLGFAPGQFPQAEAYYREAISLPLYSGLSEEEQNEVAAALREVLTEAQR